jgi:hypothetical protein
MFLCCVRAEDADMPQAESPERHIQKKKQPVKQLPLRGKENVAPAGASTITVQCLNADSSILHLAARMQEHRLARSRSRSLLKNSVSACNRPVSACSLAGFA